MARRVEALDLLVAQARVGLANAVLVQQSRLGELSREELAEVITDAWLAVAPKKLVREFLG